jgi:peptidoglycan/xylan/chitin deacetylase (PgdA/CDA1 family)
MIRAAMLAAIGAATACQRTIAETDGVFVAASEHVRVHCAVNLDSEAMNSWSSIDAGLDRAARRGEIVELYAHHPGVTVSVDTVEHVLAGAATRGLGFVTYADLARGTATFPGLALSFDDTSVDAWTQIEPLLARYGARVTFFVSRYFALQDEQRAELHQLAAAGHAIEPHSVLHLRAPQYVEDNGLSAYLADEAQPSIDALVAEGYPITTYAYPFGARTDETDRALLERVELLRSVAFTFDGEGGPCPR